MSKFKHIYHLEIIGGLVLIQKEIEADDFELDCMRYCFYEDGGRGRKRNNPLAFYPVVNTIIVSIVDNPDYIPPNQRGGVPDDGDDYALGAFEADLDALDDLMVRPTPPSDRRYDDQGDELIGQL